MTIVSSLPRLEQPFALPAERGAGSNRRMRARAGTALQGDDGIEGCGAVGCVAVGSACASAVFGHERARRKADENG